MGAGIIAALVGFTSSFAVVLAGLTAVGATPAQAASGLLAVCVTQALGMWVLSLRYRLPITLAWSTPGAALLAGTGAVAGGWSAAVGAFVATGLLIVLTGCWTRLGRLITAIPVEVAQAMLAGVLLPLCLAPLRALTTPSAAVVAPVLVVWLILQRCANRWAVPGAFVTAVVAAAIAMVAGHRGVRAAELVPKLEWTVPHWSWQAIIGIAVPLYVVTMAAQNLPGVAVMKSFGYRVPWRASMTITGLGTIAGAPAGGHAINLAAISAALAAAPSAHPDPRRRWWSTMAAGGCYLVLAPVSAALVAITAVAPAGVLETVAGLALLGTFAAALSAALGAAEHRIAATVTFLVSASGIAVLGIGAAFWAVIAGLVVRWVLAPRPPATAEAGPEVARDQVRESARENSD
ncbi:benzoate/H(+) symporter BenE family transporter [Nocardia spumae]|uniref:benzoate/H(+) symporter BenE family transporter n=1 Tax=Nocardia spumae TaxID=2887190 RepID=UPI001D15DE9B|nr:benzoate/H(+) symporter BenE family transporter [Nocardia spumae]